MQGNGFDKAIAVKYSLFQVLFNLLLWVPIFYEFQKRFGLDDTEIFGIQSIYYVVFCLFEFPTGFIADRFGYRFSMGLGGFVLTLSHVLPLSFPNYQGFLWHFIAIALARSLISGAGSAYLYEYLKAFERVEHYKKIEGDARFYSLVTRVVAWGVVGWLMSWQLTSPYIISGINALLSTVVVFLLPSLSLVTGRVKRDDTLGYINVIRHHLSLRLAILMAQGVGVFVLVRIMQVNLYQPILSSKAFSLETFGLIMSMTAVFEAFGSKLAPYLRKLAGDMTMVTFMTLVMSMTVVMIAWGQQTLTVFAFAVFSVACGLVFPIQKQVMNDAISDARVRASLLSLESILDRGICAIAVLPLGHFVELGKLPETLLVVALINGAVALSIHFAGQKVPG